MIDQADNAHLRWAGRANFTIERHTLGLDWFPSNRQKPGNEVEFAQLSSLDLSQLNKRRKAQAEARFRAISQSAFDLARMTPDRADLTFRGERLQEAVEVIGAQLLDRAWRPQSAVELAAYGEALLAAAQSFAREHHLDWPELRDAPATFVAPDEEDPRATACLTVVEAARWCLWWSAKGFGLFPDY